MASEHTAEWMSKLIDRGEDVGQCIAFLKELAEKEEKLVERNEKNAERNERRVERELESREKDRELEFKKLQLREKELALKEIDSSNEIKSKIKLPKFH